MDRLHGELIINYPNSKQSGHHWPAQEKLFLWYTARKSTSSISGELNKYHHIIKFGFNNVVASLVEFYKAMSMRWEVIPMDVDSRAVTPDLPLGVMRPGIVFSSPGKQNNLDQVSLGVHIQIPTHLHLSKMFRQTFQFSWFWGRE